MQNCLFCGKENPDTDSYCYSCGHILPSALKEMTGATARLSEVSQTLEPRRRWGTAYFGQQNRLKLKVRDYSEPITVTVVGEMVLGRTHQDASPAQPDIDLTPYNAADQGVSRRHIALSYDHDTVSVTDLGSANGTFLNGQRLIAHQARILRDGDELRLGRLVMQVFFV